MQRVPGFELQKLHRRSHWGPSYLAHDTGRGCTVELTRVQCDDWERVATIAGVWSDDLPHVFEWNIVDEAGGTWIATLFVEGLDLWDVLCGGILTENHREMVLEDVARALATLHRAGIVHRRIAPWTILIAEDEDNGQRAMLHDYELGAHQPSVFSAPEQHAGGPIGPWTDVYGYGAVMYLLVTGELPIDARRRGAGVPMPPMPTTLDPAVRARIEACLALDPAARPQSGDALVPAPSLAVRYRHYGELPEVARAVLPTEPDAANEAPFLDLLRKSPADAAVRAVYADLLEGEGDTARAAFVRSGVAAPGHPNWRAVVATATIERCVNRARSTRGSEGGSTPRSVTFAISCPQRWDALSPTSSERVRQCSACHREVQFVTTVEEAQACGDREQSIAIDPAVPRDHALESYDRARRRREPEAVLDMPPDYARTREMTAVEPPSEPPKPPRLFGRVKRWFGR